MVKPVRRKPGSFVTLSLLLGFLFLATACFPSDPQSTFDARGPVAQAQLNLFVLIFWVAVIVFVLVNGILLYTVIKYRRKPGQGLPVQTHGDTRLEIAWTIAPALVLAIIAVPTIVTIFETANPPPGDLLEVRVTGHQWWWEFEYSDLGVVTANELHVPVGQSVNLTLESDDVIHSFWVPKLAGKTDMIPGNTNFMWFSADETGEYFGQCAEFCGTAHSQMRFRVIAETREEFDAWVALQKKTPVIAQDDPGADLFMNATFEGGQRCAFCHTIEGMQIKGTVGPDLTHLAGRTTIAAGLLDNNETNLADWLRDPSAVKPGALMPDLGLTEDQISTLVTFLGSLK